MILAEKQTVLSKSLVYCNRTKDRLTEVLSYTYLVFICFSDLIIPNRINLALNVYENILASF